MASFGKYVFFKNIFGNNTKQAGTWNILPAVLTAWSNLAATSPSKTSYELYKEQAQTYKDTAEKNAKLIESQGAIALRNLRYQSKLQRGNDQLRIAASNSHMTGSNLDIVVRKEKIRAMNEMALRANYQNQILMELQNGYRKAGMAYGELAARAEGAKKSPLLAILKGIETYMGLTTRDGKVISQEANQKATVDYAHKAQIEYLDYEYTGNKKVKGDLSGDGKDYSSNEAIINPTLIAAASATSITPDSLSLNNIDEQIPIYT